MTSQIDQLQAENSWLREAMLYAADKIAKGRQMPPSEDWPGFASVESYLRSILQQAATPAPSEPSNPSDAEYYATKEGTPPHPSAQSDETISVLTERLAKAEAELSAQAEVVNRLIHVIADQSDGVLRMAKGAKATAELAVSLNKRMDATDERVIVLHRQLGGTIHPLTVERRLRDMTKQVVAQIMRTDALEGVQLGMGEHIETQGQRLEAAERVLRRLNEQASFAGVLNQRLSDMETEQNRMLGRMNAQSLFTGTLAHRLSRIEKHLIECGVSLKDHDE